VLGVLAIDERTLIVFVNYVAVAQASLGVFNSPQFSAE
jgi:hypothetical protein